MTYAPSAYMFQKGKNPTQTPTFTMQNRTDRPQPQTALPHARRSTSSESLIGTNAERHAAPNFVVIPSYLPFAQPKSSHTVTVTSHAPKPHAFKFKFQLSSFSSNFPCGFLLPNESIKVEIRTTVS